jgi:hypothetical protein
MIARGRGGYAGVPCRAISPFVVSCFRAFVFVLKEKHENTKDENSK